MRVFGKGNPFFDLLEAQSRVAHQGALSFHRMIRNIEHFGRYAEELRLFEQEGDQLTRRLANLTDATFVTPLDKQDLRALSYVLDDVIDRIEATAARFLIYRIRYPRPDVEPQALFLVQITEAVDEIIGALPRLRDRRPMQPLFRRVHALENSADEAFRNALSEIVNARDLDILTIVKWKDLYERIERSIDACETAADLIEAVVIKYT